MSDGGCLCGEVRFTTEGSAKWTGWCHCQSCRKQTGAPASAYAGFERSKVHFIRGTPVRFVSSAGVKRGFCARCGSTLTYEGARWPTEIHIHIGAFDDAEFLVPKGSAFTEERLSWFPGI